MDFWSRVETVYMYVSLQLTVVSTSKACARLRSPLETKKNDGTSRSKNKNFNENSNNIKLTWQTSIPKKGAQWTCFTQTCFFITHHRWLWAVCFPLFLLRLPLFVTDARYLVFLLCQSIYSLLAISCGEWKFPFYAGLVLYLMHFTCWAQGGSLLFHFQQQAMVGRCFLFSCPSFSLVALNDVAVTNRIHTGDV